MQNSFPTPGGTSPVRSYRTSVLLLALVILAALAPQPGAAGKGTNWCRRDPGLSIGGQEVHINFYADPAMLQWADDPIRLVVTVPVDKERVTEVLYVDDGFGYGYDLVIQTSTTLKSSNAGIDIVVAAYAPAGGRFIPMEVELVPVTTGKKPTYAKGTSDQWVSMKGTV